MKLGSVPYLNARPLVDWLDRHPRPAVELSYAVPSVLIAQLQAGAIDIAMASTFAVIEHPDLHLLPGIGVTAAKAAWSVRLLSRTAISDIRTLALDACSRSTNALARIILADRYGVTPECVELPPDRDAMLSIADAAVLIGDIGLRVHGDGFIDLDLGQEWWELTHLPFFFAGWVARDPEQLSRATPLLFDALQHGLARLDDIADEEALRLAIPRDRCYRYLAEVMRYYAGEAEHAGLAEFRRRALRLGFAGAEAVAR
ncbi:MAG: menaquinone biosynthetic enzyme MqnA/MqnD family protein [Armatimonadota bacterium]